MLRYFIIFILILLFITDIFAGTPSNVECIAPANPGGGWDWTCRAAGKMLQDLKLIRGSMNVINMPGTSGARAYAYAAIRRKKDGNLIFSASPATLTAIAQGLYRFTEKDVKWLGAVATDHSIIAVKADAPWDNLTDLVRSWKKNPEKIIFGGGSAIMGQDHMKAIILAKAAGIDIKKVKYVPYYGGGEALTQLIGGFINVFTGDLSEVIGQIEAKKIKVLALLSEKRLNGKFSYLSVAKEFGYNAIWPIWRGFYMPPNVSIEDYKFWNDALKKMCLSDHWNNLLNQYSLDNFCLIGDAFNKYIEDSLINLRELIKELSMNER
jgi:putative tricarboxylic transport membrane protein